PGDVRQVRHQGRLPRERRRPHLDQLAPLPRGLRPAAVPVTALAKRARRGDTVGPMRSVLLRWCALLFAVAVAAPASAHPVPFSYLDVEVHDRAIDGRVRAHLTDLARVAGLADPGDLARPEVFAVHRSALEHYLAAHIALDGDAFARVEWGPVSLVDGGE